MEGSSEVGLENEALSLYISEVKETPACELEEHVILNEVELATDFLQKAGLSNFSKTYQRGEKITDSVLSDTIRKRNLTEKQAQTVRSRVKTLNKTLDSHQPRRKQRQDVRDVAWNAETSSTGTRSRSATPDSLDSIEGNQDEISDEEQHFSMPAYSLSHRNMVFKGKIKWTSHETAQERFSRPDRGDVAHLGSDNVILKGYHPLNEYGTLPRRERSGSDPSDLLLESLDPDPEAIINGTDSLHRKLSRSHSSLLGTNRTNQVYIMPNECISFEGLVQQNAELKPEQKAVDSNSSSVAVDDLTDSEYQYLKRILWVEVTAIFDQYKIPVLKRKSVSKNKRGNVFGVNLSSLIMRDMPRPTDTSMVPQIFQSIIYHLNTRCIAEDGILRVAGPQQKLIYLCSEVEAKFYNNRRHVENILSSATVHDLTGVLKKLIRDLPDSIFTTELFDMFYKCSMIPVKEDKIKAFNLLVLLMPIEHRNTYRLLLQFCSNIIKHQEQNRMNLHNVAMITAPSFFTPRLLLQKEISHNIKSLKSLPKEELLKQVNGAAICCCIIEEMLINVDSLWMVPSDLVKQAREAQQYAQDRKDNFGGKDKRSKYGKKKLQRSSTQYHSNDRVKREYFYI